MTGKQNLPALSETQLEIMNVVWDRKECSVAAVWDVLNERRGVSRNTVHTLIVRLEEKGWLRRREGKTGYLYSATASRDDVQKRSIHKLIDTVFNGSAESLVLTLLNDGPLSKAEANRIRQAIEAARRKKS